MKKPTINIGIAAYNEENNIGFLLKSLLSQNETNFILNKIIVISDASIDKTDEIVTKLNNDKIALIRNKNRKGQNYSQNHIFKISNTDIVILFEADTCPKDKDFISKLINPINKKNILFVQGNPIPLKPLTFFEKIVYQQSITFTSFIEDSDEAIHLVISGGAGRAFSKELYKKLKWPKNVPEDSYCYYWCKKQNIPISFVKSAKCFFRLPQSLKDYLIKREKIHAAQKSLSSYFKNLDTRYSIPKKTIMDISLKFLLSSPFLFISYIFIKIIERLTSFDNGFSYKWRKSKSTKLLFAPSDQS